MPEFKKGLQKEEEILEPLASNFLDRLIEVQFKKKTTDRTKEIEKYTQYLLEISTANENGDRLLYQTLNNDDKKVYNSIALMYQNWQNIHHDQGGYVTLNEEEIHPSFRVEIHDHNPDFLKKYLTPDEANLVLDNFKENDLLAYSLCLFVFSCGICEKDLMGMKFQDFEPRMRGRNNLLKGLIFTDSGGHINDKGSSSRIYLLNPFSREKILNAITQHRNLGEVKSSHTLFKGMGKIVNKAYLKELCQRIGSLIGRSIDFKTLRGTHARLLYEKIPLDVIGFSLRVELIHSALIGFGVGLKHIAQALPVRK